MALNNSDIIQSIINGTTSDATITPSSNDSLQQTKADRIVTKAAWVVWSDAWKATYRSSGDHATAFTVSGSAITYAGD